MATRSEQLQRIVKLYSENNGDGPFDMEKATKWALLQGVKPPKAKTPEELLRAEMSHAAAATYERDAATGLSYRRFHAIRTRNAQGLQRTQWVGIEKATRPQMLMSLINRRQQMVGDALHLKIDEQIWNSRNAEKAPIQLDMDFTYDVEEQLHAPGLGDQEVAANLAMSARYSGVSVAIRALPPFSPPFLLASCLAVGGATSPVACCTIANAVVFRSFLGIPIG
jgi:hypothetical protein